MEWEIDRDSETPIHKQVELLILQLTQQEEFQQGKLLPGEDQLAEEIGISRNTVRMAMNQLVEAGFIERSIGTGSWGKQDSVKTSLRAWISFSREMEQRGYDIKEYKIDLLGVLFY